MVNAGGMYTAHVDINKAGDKVVCGNYIGANAAIFNVNKDGTLSEVISKVDFAEAKEGDDCSEVAKTIKCGPNKVR